MDIDVIISWSGLVYVRLSCAYVPAHWRQPLTLETQLRSTICWQGVTMQVTMLHARGFPIWRVYIDRRMSKSLNFDDEKIEMKGGEREKKKRERKWELG